MPEFALIVIAFFSSALAAAVGMGGGILLIACMPGLLPTQAILPVHAVTQLASNTSRSLLAWRHIDSGLIPGFTLGAVAGAWLGAEVYRDINLVWLPGVMGLIILLITWFPLPRPPGGGFFALLALGFYQTGLGMVVGATGPLGAAVLSHYNSGKDWLVVNTAVYMSINHGLRVLAFAALGFVFAPWLYLILGMVAASIAGSWGGTRLRSRIPQAIFKPLFKWLITLLAFRMMLMSAYEFF